MYIDFLYCSVLILKHMLKRYVFTAWLTVLNIHVFCILCYFSKNKYVSISTGFCNQHRNSPICYNLLLLPKPYLRTEDFFKGKTIVSMKSIHDFEDLVSDKIK